MKRNCFRKARSFCFCAKRKSSNFFLELIHQTTDHVNPLPNGNINSGIYVELSVIFYFVQLDETRFFDEVKHDGTQNLQLVQYRQLILPYR